MAFNINVITLPGHSSHVMQLFDIGLGSPMKRRYTELLKAYLKDNRKMIQNSVDATLRNCAVHAIVESWQQSCTPPFDADIVVSTNPQIQELTPRELEIIQNRRETARLDINNSLLTSVAKIREISDSIRSESDRPLCKHIGDFHSMHELFDFAFTQGKERKNYQFSKPMCLRTFDFGPLDQKW